MSCLLVLLTVELWEKSHETAESRQDLPVETPNRFSRNGFEPVSTQRRSTIMRDFGFGKSTEKVEPR